MTMKNQKVKKLVEVFPAPRRKLEAELIRRKNQGSPVSLKYLANEAELFMQKLSIILFIAFSVCLANNSQEVNIDSIKSVLSDLAEKQKKTEKSVDSLSGKFTSDEFISLKAANESLKLYNKSFSNIQTSFAIFVSIIGVLALVFSWFNTKSASDAKNDITKLESKIEVLKYKSEEFDKKFDKKDIATIMVRDTNLYDKKNSKKKEKLKDLAKSIRNNPNASHYEKALAKAVEYYYSDDYDKALENYEEILKEYRDEITLTLLPQIYFQMAFIYHKKNLFDRAMNEYKDILKLDPLFAKASYNIACLYVSKYDSTKDSSNLDEAFKYLEESLENEREDKELSIDYIENDSDLNSLKNDPRYKILKSKYW